MSYREISTTAQAAGASPFLPHSMAFTTIAALGATIAAVISLQLGLAPWAMFIGWVAYFTRPTSWRVGLATGLCLWLGISLGALATLVLGMMAPVLGNAAFAVIVFAIASLVVSMRKMPAINNILAWFLGLIAFFAAHPEPSMIAVLELGGAASLGILTGRLVQTAQVRLSLS